MRKFRMQLVDIATGRAIQTSGGKAHITAAGAEAKLTLYTEAGASLANPVSLTNGILEFHTADDVASVDVYGMAPSGHAFVVKAVAASGPNSIGIDKSRSQTTLVIPFSSEDAVDATEFDTGFDIPTGALVLADVSVDVTNAAATETIDVGILTGEAGGDPDGFIDGVSLTNVATVVGTLTQGAATLGVLLSVQDSANAGDLVPEAHVCDGTAKSITYTLTAGTDALVGEGFIKIPMLLPVASL